MSWCSSRDLARLAVVAAAHIATRLPGPATKALAWLTDRGEPRRHRDGLRALSRIGIDGQPAATILHRSQEIIWRDLMATIAPTPKPGLIEHLDRFDIARAAGRGVILVESAVYGLRAAGKRTLATTGTRVHQVHGFTHFGGAGTRLAGLLTDHLLTKESEFVAGIIRLQPGMEVAAMRDVISLLARGAVVVVGGDGDLSQRFVTVDFLNHRVPIPIGWVSLARLTGAPLLPIFPHPYGEGSRLEIGLPLAVSGDRDQLAATAIEYTNQLDQRVRSTPAAYCGWWRLATLEASADPNPTKHFKG